ncbi:Vesicle transport through interaction with t-SNAREs-like protein 1B [Acropora cervicornis]|uniref:Vesicle transport through interaction with t-SNAREs-like protein 1B n=1 Tax=Acropora cervicornis TaxID=6130 RepID=A0AAD9Q335_ACRCE|nr:Vesicle transport through interaction with t-SNAREs-like protein 1B [Acropora cervicornis]
MSSEKFEDLEDELKTLLEDTSNKVRNKIPRLSGEMRKSAVREVEKKIEDANLISICVQMGKISNLVPKIPVGKTEISETKTDHPLIRTRQEFFKWMKRCAEILETSQPGSYEEAFRGIRFFTEIEEMEEEASFAPGSFKNSMMGRIQSYKREFDQLRRGLTKPSGQAHVTFGREELFDSDPMAPQRSKLMHGTETLNKASDSIARSTRVAEETGKTNCQALPTPRKWFMVGIRSEQIGGEIIEDLGDQRESLIRTRDRLKDVDQDLSKSRRILNSMAIRIATNKIILLCIIVVELAILGAVVYIKFFKKKKQS